MQLQKRHLLRIATNRSRQISLSGKITLLIHKKYTYLVRKSIYYQHRHVKNQLHSLTSHLSMSVRLSGFGGYSARPGLDGDWGASVRGSPDGQWPGAGATSEPRLLTHLLRRRRNLIVGLWRHRRMAASVTRALLMSVWSHFPGHWGRHDFASALELKRTVFCFHETQAFKLTSQNK